MVRPRCWYFDQDTGQPLRGSDCPVRGCGFVHPDSPQWKNAPKSKSSHSRRRSRERSPAASTSSHNSSMKKGDSVRRKTSGSWSSRDRGPPTPPNGSSWSQRGPGSESNQVTGWGDTSHKQPSGRGESTTKPSGGWGGDSGDWGEPANNQRSTWGEPAASATDWGTRPLGSNSIPLPPPPPPPPRSPPPPPPPPPAAESSFSVVSHPKPAESSRPVGEKAKEPAVSKSAPPKSGSSRKQYWTRLILLSDAITLRNEYTEVTRNLEARRKMQNTSRYTHVSENVQSKLDRFAQESEEKGKELKAKMDSILSKLVDAEVWPNGPSDAIMPVTDQAAVQQYSDIQARLDRLETLSKTLELEIETVRRESLSMSDARVSIGQKRRQETTSDGHSETNKDLLKRLERLEVHVADIDNQTTQQTENLRDIVDARLEDKLDSLRLGDLLREDGEVADLPAAGGSRHRIESSQDGGDLQEQVTKLIREQDEFSRETASLITQHAEATADMLRLKEENANLKKTVEGYQSTVRNLQETTDCNDRQIKALMTAVKAIRDHSSQPPPTIDSCALEPMRKRILQEVLSSVNNALFAFRGQCEAAMLSSREETLKQIGAQFGRTVDLVNIIYGYFNRSLQVGNGSPLPD